MKVKRGKNLTEEYKLLREILWKEKYVESGENIMVHDNAFIYEYTRKKRRLEQIDEFGYLLEDWPEDDYIDTEV